MLKVNLTDGRTLRYDLSNPKDATAWAELARNHAFQNQITGLTVACNGVSYSLPRPRDFKDTMFLFAEYVPENLEQRIKGGERLLCYAGDVQVALLAHAAQRAVRVDVTRVGKMRYSANRDG